MPKRGSNGDLNNNNTDTISDVDALDTPNNSECILDVPDYFPDLNVKELLESSPEGPSVLKEYETREMLSSSNQQLLMNVIGRWIYPWLKNNQMKEHHYLSIIKKLYDCFPEEPIGVYYMPPVPKRLSPINKPIPMRGKLPDKIKNIKYTTGINCKRKLPNNFESTDERQQRYTELLGTHEEDIEWLKNNRDPWDLVEQKWSNTFNVRLNSKHNSVYDFIKEWTILNDLRSKSLISLDFEQLYPGKSGHFATGWSLFFDRVKTLRILKYSNEKVIQPWKELITELGNGPAFNDLKIAIELSILAFLIPPKGRASKKIKYSTKESLESILIFVENPGDITTEIENQKQRAREKKDSVQPYVIIQGNMREHNQVLLVIDDIKYQFTSATNAFDCLFKCFHVLQAQYPKASSHLHLLIQRCVYRVTTRQDILPLNIIDIINNAYLDD
ncbi:uncharacterized protein LOC130670405 [Microplitis mediator]|uniref:uncharacterized protein LOC130670405 n=1 Tax=Microplitis mediator TaxID=375433 RepID=UPI002556174C|nr:uncharacterized protein LOC130670405 [Microplitis mediator]